MWAHRDVKPKILGFSNQLNTSNMPDPKQSSKLKVLWIG
jgi:hypothetical protein